MPGNNGLFFDGRTTSPSTTFGTTPAYTESTTFGTTPTYTENTTIGTTSEAEHLWTILWVFLGLVVFIISIFLFFCNRKKGKKLLLKEWIKVNSVTQKMLLIKKGWLNPVQKTKQIEK